MKGIVREIEIAIGNLRIEIWVEIGTETGIGIEIEIGEIHKTIFAIEILAIVTDMKKDQG